MVINANLNPPYAMYVSFWAVLIGLSSSGGGEGGGLKIGGGGEGGLCFILIKHLIVYRRLITRCDGEGANFLLISGRLDTLREALTCAFKEKHY